MLSKWDAVSALDRVFDDVMGSMVGTATSARAFEPAVDVRTNEDEIVFVCDVPGVKEKDLEITLENHTLSIKGARKFESSAGAQMLVGRPYGSFASAYALPDSLDEERLEANLADGVLTIRVPKQPKAKPRKIEVRALKE